MDVPVPDIASTESSTARAPGRLLYYRHPMNPSITSPTPARDEMGMKYVPVYDNGQALEGEVHLTDPVVQKLGVRTAPVAVGILPVQVRAPGVVQFDARSVSEASYQRPRYPTATNWPLP